MKASIIITTFNRDKLLDFGLKSLSTQNFSKNEVEILVLNDSCSDNDTQKVCDKHGDLNIRYFKTNRKDNGWRVPGFAINFGVKQSLGKYIFISCAEMYHMDNTINLMIDELDKNNNLLTIPNSAKDDGGGFLNALRRGVGITDNLYNQLGPLHNVHLPFFMGMTKENFVKIGGYDEDFIGFGYDDNDIVDRMNKSGNSHYKVNCRIVHLYHDRLSFKDPATQEQFQINRSLYYERRLKIIRNDERDWGQSF